MQELLPFFRTETGELLERTHALDPLRRSQTAKSLERFLDLDAFGCGKSAQSFFLFRRREIEELPKIPHYLLALLVGQGLPPLDPLLNRFSGNSRGIGPFFCQLSRSSRRQLKIEPQGCFIVQELLLNVRR